ncbi:hypothetical protein FRACA_2200016 [Frankia canadensis]|uniref:Uncharacterized protein n=1 Tax=Frankia canadensis TaxID=1836972 RepID=A0A2I2KR35_9ACTN|nr:hypothetical protein FRACA_2200016 [Frankia canadensis]SOU55412.1 hypothetical protein FRACA_2200016 [Frankia canadensis]
MPGRPRPVSPGRGPDGQGYPHLSASESTIAALGRSGTRGHLRTHTDTHGHTTARPADRGFRRSTSGRFIRRGCPGILDSGQPPQPGRNGATRGRRMLLEASERKWCETNANR